MGEQRKENDEKTPRNRTARGAPKWQFRQTHVSCVKTFPKDIKMDDFGNLVPPDQLGQGNVKKALQKHKEHVEGKRKPRVAENLKKTLLEESVNKTLTVVSFFHIENIRFVENR